MTKDIFQRTAGPLFDGATFDQQRDGARLQTTLDRVRHLMQTGRPFTLRELADLTGASEAGVSARLRDLRKPQHGSHRIESKCAGGGLWTYRMVSR